MRQDFGVTFSIKNAFFDRELVIREIGKTNAKALSRAGAFVQRRARSSMKRKGYARKPPKNLTGKAYQRWLNEITNRPSSAPGRPPNTHTNDPYRTLKNIQFGYRRDRQSVIIGPVKLNGEAGSVPALHEFGGTKVIRGKHSTRTARYPARSFMGPALAAEAPKFPGLWSIGP